MSWNKNTGYIPPTYDENLQLIIDGVNSQLGTSYTPETFVGTDLYRIFYPVIQLSLEDNANTSLIFNKLQDFFIDTNQKIIDPTTTDNALLDALSAAGYVASVRDNSIAQAGKLAICVDLSDIESDNLETEISIIGGIILDHSFAGCAFDGTQTVNKNLSNGQVREVKFEVPTLVPTLWRVTITPSRNTEIVIDTEQQVKDKLFANLNSLYKLGFDIEPEKYFEIIRDAQYASDILLEYSTNGGANWYSIPIENTYEKLHTYAIDDITVIFVGI